MWKLPQLLEKHVGLLYSHYKYDGGLCEGLHLICIPVIHVGLLLIQIPYSCSVYMILGLKEETEGCRRSTNDQETPGSYVVGSRPTSVDFKLKQGEK